MEIRTAGGVRQRALLASGAIAALGMGGAMLVARVIAGAPLPPEMLFAYTARLLGVPAVFNLVHALPWDLDRYAKFVLFGVTVVVYLGGFALLALAYPALRRVSNGAGRSWTMLLAVLLPAALSVLLVGGVLLPLQGLGFFGLGPANFGYPPLASHAWAAAFGGVFGLLLALLAPKARHDPGRRATLLALLRGVVTVGVGAGAARLLATLQARAQALIAPLGSIVGLSPEVTPVADHYRVSKNVFDPSVREQGWTLEIGGLVDHPLSLSLADLQALPAVERTSTLICISNEVGGDLIGNSSWTGVRLADLLEMAGVQANATELVLRAADNYSDSFPLAAAQRDGTIVAYLQNGEPLTRDHGFPARVLVPGIYGMKNVKWVVAIDVTDSDHLGYWQTRGWSDSAVVRTMSRIDTARATVLPDGRAAIGGVAFAGLRGVRNVEVSLDAGDSWQPALLDPAANELSWNLWGFAWDAAPGEYRVLVRATDGSGELQTEQRSRPLPDGASGWHQLRVRVG